MKCSGNWMGASKLEGEGVTMRKAMLQLGITVNGGDDE